MINERPRQRPGNTFLKLVVLLLLIAAFVHTAREVATWYFLERGGLILKANLARDKDHRPSLYWLRLAETADPSNPMVHLYMGLYHLKSAEPKSAENEFRRFGELAEKDLGYFFRVLYAIQPPSERSAPATAAASVGMTIVSSAPVGTPLPNLPAIDLAAAEVAPQTAVLFAWIGIHRNDKPLVESAFSRAAPLDGRSYQYHLARAVWDLRTGEKKSGIDHLERSLELRDNGGEGASGLGLVPFAFHLPDEMAGGGPRIGPWIGRITTSPDANNHLASQLLAAMAVLMRQRSDYKRSIHWAELARKRYGGELAKLGLVDHIERMIWPLNYWSLVARAARKYRQDPLLVLSMVRTESHFNAQAVSHVGARGLMQLMPRTAQWIASTMKWGTFSEEVLSNPSDNIEFGTYYLMYLRGALGEGPEAQPWVLAAYNGGIGNVKRWLSLKEAGSGPDLAAIEFKETRDYITRVTESYKNYVRLYGDKPGELESGEPVEEPLLAPSAAPAPGGAVRDPRRRGARKGKRP